MREISVGAGTGADVMAGGAGAAGPATDLRHQPPGISHSKQRISQNIVYFLRESLKKAYFFRDILRYPKNQVQKSTYPGISQTNKSNCGISWDIPKITEKRLGYPFLTNFFWGYPKLGDTPAEKNWGYPGISRPLGYPCRYQHILG